MRRGKWEEIGVKGEGREWGWDASRRRDVREGGEGAAGDEEDEEEFEEKEDLGERNKWVVEGDLGWSDEALRRGAV